MSAIGIRRHHKYVITYIDNNVMYQIIYHTKKEALENAYDKCLCFDGVTLKYYYNQSRDRNNESWSLISSVYLSTKMK